MIDINTTTPEGRQELRRRVEDIAVEFDDTASGFYQIAFDTRYPFEKRRAQRDAGIAAEQAATIRTLLDAYEAALLTIEERDETIGNYRHMVHQYEVGILRAGKGEDTIPVIMEKPES